MTSTLFQRGFAFLDRTAQVAAGEEVRYTRAGSVLSDLLPAILTAAEIEQLLDTESVVVGKQFTWRVDGSELWFDGAPTRPQRLDQIEWERDGTFYVFDVMPAGGQFEITNTDPRSKWIPVTCLLAEKR